MDCVLKTFVLKRNLETRELSIEPLFRATESTAGMMMQISEELKKEKLSIILGEFKHELLGKPIVKYLCDSNRIYIRQYEGGRAMEITTREASEGVLRRKDWCKRQEEVAKVIREDAENRLNGLPEDVLSRILDYVTQTRIMSFRVTSIFKNLTIECD